MEQTPYLASSHSVRPDFCSSFLGETVGSFVTTNTAIHRVTCIGTGCQITWPLSCFCFLGFRVPDPFSDSLFICCLSQASDTHFHTDIQKQDNSSLSPLLQQANRETLQLVQLVRTGSGGLVCTNHCLDHRARTAMSSSLRRNKGKSASEQVNHVSYCRSLPSLESKGSHLT